MEALTPYVDLVVAVTQVGILAFTAVLIRESYLLRVRHETPEVICYLQVATDGTSNIYFVVENVGLGTARNIRFRVAGNRDWWEKRGIRLRAEFLDRGIPALSPGGRVVTSFGSWFQLFQNKTRYSIRIETNFLGRGGKELNATSFLDPWIFVGSSRPGSRNEREAVEALKKIERTLSSWTSPTNRLSIRVLNGHESCVEEEELEAWLDEQWAQSQKATPSGD